MLGNFASADNKAGPASSKKWTAQKDTKKGKAAKATAKDKPTPTQMDTKESTEKLLAMGFAGDAIKSVILTEKIFDKALAKLLSMGDQARVPLTVCGLTSLAMKIWIYLSESFLYIAFKACDGRSTSRPCSRACEHGFRPCECCRSTKGIK